MLSDLSAREKVALRWADAYLIHPDDVPEDLRRDLLGYFSPAEIVELLALLMKCQAGSKFQIALGIEPESMPLTLIPV